MFYYAVLIRDTLDIYVSREELRLKKTNSWLEAKSEAAKRIMQRTQQGEYITMVVNVTGGE